MLKKNNGIETFYFILFYFLKFEGNEEEPSKSHPHYFMILTFYKIKNKK